jgi:hypothetical protein
VAFAKCGLGRQARRSGIQMKPATSLKPKNDDAGVLVVAVAGASAVNAVNAVNGNS